MEEVKSLLLACTRARPIPEPYLLDPEPPLRKLHGRVVAGLRVMYHRDRDALLLLPAETTCDATLELLGVASGGGAKVVPPLSVYFWETHLLLFVLNEKIHLSLALERLLEEASELDLVEDVGGVELRVRPTERPKKPMIPIGFVGEGRLLDFDGLTFVLAEGEFRLFLGDGPEIGVLGTLALHLGRDVPEERAEEVVASLLAEVGVAERYRYFLDILHILALARRCYELAPADAVRLIREVLEGREYWIQHTIARGKPSEILASPAAEELSAAWLLRGVLAIFGILIPESWNVEIRVALKGKAVADVGLLGNAPYAQLVAETTYDALRISGDACACAYYDTLGVL